jgi:putative hydrolase of the HAD superfamily
VPKITAVFSDVGGVLLTNGWDRGSRRKACEKFDLDGEEFEDRHELVAAAFDQGDLTLDQYLDRTVFYRSRSNSRQDFKAFMYAQSEAFPESLAVMGRFAQSRKHFLATINNESLDLNLYRINRFGLRDYFSAFFSSCFLHAQKPEEAIFRRALEITQRPPEECVFIDDRALNLECARLLGMHTIHFQSARQLESELASLAAET